MTNKPVTRSRSKKNFDFKTEKEEENPFVPRRNLPQDPDFNRSRSIPADLDFLSSTTISGNISCSPFDSSRTNSNLDITLPFLFESTLKTTDQSVIERKSSSVKMAIPANQTVSLKDAMKLVPEFDGSNISLGQFIEGCLEAKDMVEPGAEKNLVRLIKSKIFGEARKSMSGQNFETVEQIRNFLTGIFVPRRSIQLLVGELGREYQREGESVLTYANRMREIGRRILEMKRLTTGAIDPVFRASTESSVMECFREGLLPAIEHRLSNNDDMGSILKEAINIETRLEARDALRHVRDRNEKIRTRIIHYCQVCKREGHETNECRTRQKYCDFCKKNRAFNQ